MIMKRFHSFVVLIVSWILSGLATGTPPDARVEMNEIFSGLAVILPLSLNPGQFSDKKNSQKIEASLKKMQKVVEELSDKSRGSGDDFHFVADNLKSDLKHATRHFNSGNFRRSAFIVQNMTENCFVCHSKYEGKSRAPDTGHFLADIDLKAMPERDAARLKVVTRQFRSAVESYEKAIWEFRRSLPGAPLQEYLSVTLSVLKEPDIPAVLFERLSRLEDPTFSHRLLLKGWKDDLEDLKKSAAWKAVTLSNLRILLQKARNKTDYMFDRRGLVYWVAVRGYLNELSLAKHSGQVQAELFYWLGVIATMFEGSYWVVQMPEYLERSIRSDPGGSYAVRAMRLLENNVTEGFTGSAGTYIPKEEQQKLDDLRALVRSSQPVPRANSQAKPEPKL